MSSTFWIKIFIGSAMAILSIAPAAAKNLTSQCPSSSCAQTGVQDQSHIPIPPPKTPIPDVALDSSANGEIRNRDSLQVARDSQTALTEGGIYDPASPSGVPPPFVGEKGVNVTLPRMYSPEGLGAMGITANGASTSESGAGPSNSGSPG